MDLLYYIVYGVPEPDVALFINRIAVGVFFIVSGYFKLFNKVRHRTLVETLKDCKVPFIWFNQWFVPWVEFLGGIAVTLGFLAQFASLGMMAILAVAIWSEGEKRVRMYKPIDGFDVICNTLYLPEVLYLVMLLVVRFSGPGAWSLDSLFA